MSDIDGTLVVAGAQIIRAGGYDHEGFLREYGFSEAELVPGERVSWARYVAMGIGIIHLAGGEDAAVRWAHHYVEFVPEPVRAMFAATRSVSALNELSVAAMAAYYTPTEVRVVESTPEGMAMVVRVRDGFCGARPFLLLNGGAIAGMTRYLRLPDQEVTCEATEREARYRITYPRVPTVEDQVRLLVEQIEPPGGKGRLLAAAHEISLAGGLLAPRDRALLLAEQHWDLTPRQLEVLSHLLRGASNKEIASAISCSAKTAEHHVTAIIRCAGCQSRTEVVGGLWDLVAGVNGGKAGPNRREL